MIRGRIDILDTTRVAGWITDTADHSRSLTVDIVVDGQSVGVIAAEAARSDLARIGYGDGRKGFHFQFPDTAMPGDHDVEVRESSSGTAIDPGPMKVYRTTGSIQTRSAERRRRAGVKRVILHIGPPKTGTKYLQYTLTGLADKLNDIGILYPMPQARQSGIYAHHNLVISLYAPVQPALDVYLSSIANTNHHTVVLSCEGFGEPPETSLAILKSHFGDADYDIVFYARRWSDWIPSQWKQAVKQGSAETLHEYYVSLISNAYGLNAINFTVTLDKFARVFGHESITVASYSDLLDANINLSDHFFRNFLDWQGPLVVLAGNVHESVETKTAEWFRVTNAILNDAGVPTHMAAFNAYPVASETDEMRLIHAAMDRHIKHLKISDQCYALKLVWDEIVAKYGPYTLGGQPFQPADRSVSYVHADYLMEPGVVDALLRLARTYVIA